MGSTANKTQIHCLFNIHVPVLQGQGEPWTLRHRIKPPKAIVLLELKSVKALFLIRVIKACLSNTQLLN